ncbi:pyrroloquinoline-quinone synthase PqqC [Stenotrophomonas sp. MMGLT7]|uniref:pyrroloquinoline-quinone synthase PqqC n=1 Tax=Stenotrophomonas sp. MMGLT7 TaxID=2901227 RepID=UPI001E54CD34|nr:pyrroloquinoline-quinone synthase PqqC [Stenotrophomonas sp. MMGLT7]MCD7097421.1 pyrroloquinoline-quinone synthase PqqC [Stenotrophomonas sp. MMGLT7]
MTDLLSPAQLEAELRAIGTRLYHDQHPYHRLMRDGRLTRGQIQAWALNRFEYQRSIPLKDAAIMARMHDPALRRIWRQRIVDHDGNGEGEGGIARWLHLTDALGLDRELVLSGRGQLPATRFAVNAYLHFVSERSLLEAIASSLTELFSPQIISNRVSGMLRHYDFVSRDALAYFDHRLSEAPRDSDFALDYVKRHADSVEKQQQVLAALHFKCGVLWSQLDALHLAYVADPSVRWPDAFVPDDARAAA